MAQLSMEDEKGADRETEAVTQCRGWERAIVVGAQEVRDQDYDLN